MRQKSTKAFTKEPEKARETTGEVVGGRGGEEDADEEDAGEDDAGARRERDGEGG